ncbi:MAG: hypothetical protein RID09_17075 [Coleofasciculus sp. G1-WW12-02]
MCIICILGQSLGRDRTENPAYTINQHQLKLNGTDLSLMAL